MATSIFQNRNWWYHSQYTYGYISTSYDRWRDGSTQNYRIYWSGGISSGARYDYGIIVNVLVDGTWYRLGEVSANQGTGWYREGNVTVSVPNKTSGTTSIAVAVYRASDSALIWYSGDYTMDVDPAYPVFTTHSINSATETTITVNWNCDVQCDYLQYRTESMSDWRDASGYPTYTITGLIPNTLYRIKTRARGTASQLWTETDWISATTYAYPHVLSHHNFTIGNPLSVTVYNPLGRTYDLEIIGNDGSVCSGYHGSSTNPVGFNDSGAIDRFYKSIPNSNTGNFVVRLIYGSFSLSTGAATYSIPSNSSNPNFSNWSYEDVNSKTLALTGNNQIIIKDYSTVRGVITTANKMSGKNYANPSYYKFTVGSQTPKTANYNSSSTVNVGNLTATTNTFAMSAIDSRGNSTTVNKTASNYKTYSPISITSINAVRTGNVGSEVTLTVSGTIWNSSFGAVTNTITGYEIRYKATSESDSQYKVIQLTNSPTVSGNSFTFTEKIKGDLDADGFSIVNSFNISVYFKDRLSGNYKVITLGPGNPNVAYHKNGIAINAPYDKNVDGALQVNGKIISDYISYFNTLSLDADAFEKVNINEPLNRSGLYTIFAANTWYHLINIRHRNGKSDGISYGMQMRRSLSNTNNPLEVRVQNGGLGWSDWEIIDRWKKLYDNASGTNGTVTLSETIANFSYVDVFVRNSDTGYSYSQRISSPSGRGICIYMNEYNPSQERFYSGALAFTFSGTSMVPTVSHRVISFKNGEGFNISLYENMRIYKIVGYR